MPVLRDYDQFTGLHWETGSVRNYYAYRGVKAPHTRQPYSEAMLLGVSGGIVMGYFSFAYEGYDPHARILTRNTFDPLNTLLGRLGVVQNLVQTSRNDTAVQNLVQTLEQSVPGIVWADMFSLPYNALPYDEGMWGMMPVVVYGYDATSDQVWIADQARAPLTISTTELAAARGRVKKFKYRLLTLEPPDPDKLPGAVRKGIWDCIKLFTEAPPKGTKNNFGLAAYRWWADLLIKPKARLSWEREFPAGTKMYAGLVSAFTDINTFGKDGNAERAMYADFLDEASQVLDNPALVQAAALFRRSADAWDALSKALLPESAPILRETRQLLLRRHRLFLENGGAALEEMRKIDQRLEEIKLQVASNFPLDSGGVIRLREELSEQIIHIYDIEKEAIEALQQAMS